MKSVLIAAALGCAMVVAFPAAAAPNDMSNMNHMSGMDEPAASGAAAPSTGAFQSADQRMMADMNAPYVGDADRDFVAHMIPHHQGAVAMAEVELKYGKDPAMRKLATDIVRAQRKEIALMRRWQATHGVK